MVIHRWIKEIRGSIILWSCELSRGDSAVETFAGSASNTSYSLVVDTFTVFDSQSSLSAGSSFAAIDGPNYSVLLRVTNDVPGGGGSHSFRYAGAGNNSLTLQ